MPTLRFHAIRDLGYGEGSLPEEGIGTVTVFLDSASLERIQGLQVIQLDLTRRLDQLAGKTARTAGLHLVVR